MMNLIKGIFFKEEKNGLGIPKINHDYSTLTSYNQLLIEKVIWLLGTNPDSFSARWFNGDSIDGSVRSKDKQVLIVIETGEILNPTRPKMTKEQKELIKRLIIPIVEKDSKHLIKKLICDCD